MWLKNSRVVYIDTRWLFLKVMVLIVTAATTIAYFNWNKVTEVEFNSVELEARWTVSDSETIRQICDGLKKSKTIAGVKSPSGGTKVRLYSKREIREYLWDGSGYLLDLKTGKVIKADYNLSKHFELAALEIKNRSPFGEILDWKEVKEIFEIGERVVIRDIDTGIKFMARRTGGYTHADIVPLNREDTQNLRTIYKETINWKRRAVVVQIGKKKIAASLTGAPHVQGKYTDNDLEGKMGLYFSNEKKNYGNSLSHQMMIWKASGKTRKYLKNLSPEELIIAIFTAIDQQDLKTLKSMLKQPKFVKSNELEQVLGVTVTGLKKKDILSYDVTVSVSYKKGPYNKKRYFRIDLYKDDLNLCYLADNEFLDCLFVSENKALSQKKNDKRD